MTDRLPRLEFGMTIGEAMHVERQRQGIRPPDPEAEERRRAKRQELLERIDRDRADREALRADPSHVCHWEHATFVRLASGGCLQRLSCRCGRLQP